MANNARVLFRMADASLQDFATEEEFLAEVYLMAGGEFGDWLGDEIEYIVPQAKFEIDPSEAIIGSKEPEKLKEQAGKWNQLIEDYVRKTLNPFEQFQKAKGFASLADVFSCLEHSKEEQQEFQDLTEHSYDTALWSFRHAIGALDDRFLHGDDMAVISDLGMSLGFKRRVKLAPEELAHLQEHPEEYVIIDIIYH